MTRSRMCMNTHAGHLLPRAAAVLLLGASLGLSSCSYVPDWGNPVVWYDSVFTGDGDAPPKAEPGAAQAARGEPATAQSDSRDFPNLRTVPERAPETSSSAERQRVAQGLVADRDNARYTDQVLRAGGTPTPPAPPTQIARAEPAPTPAVTPPPAPPAAPKPAAAPPPPPKPMVAPKLVAPAPAPEPKAVTPPPAPVQQVAKARLPKLDLQAPSRTQASAPPPPPPSAVPQVSAPTPRSIVQPRTETAAAPPYPPLVGTVPGRVTSGGTPSIMRSEDSAAPAQVAASAAPQPVPPVARLTPARPALVAPAPAQMASLTSVGPEQDVLAQAFSQALAQSASTVTTAPAGTSFGTPTAAPLSPAQTSVPDIVRETYNQTLVAGSGVAPQATATAASGTSVASFVPSGPATIYFGNGSSSLNGKAKSVIRDIAEAYKARRGVLRVVGHASHRTKNLPVHRHKLVNFRISLDRATAVANELIKLGVDRDAIQIAAVSDSDPVYYESMPEGEAGNRRAEIFYSF